MAGLLRQALLLRLGLNPQEPTPRKRNCSGSSEPLLSLSSQTAPLLQAPPWSAALQGSGPGSLPSDVRRWCADRGGGEPLTCGAESSGVLRCMRGWPGFSRQSLIALARIPVATGLPPGGPWIPGRPRMPSGSCGVMSSPWSR
jgi:hypothetical protein